jgi:hypothetical protein
MCLLIVYMVIQIQATPSIDCKSIEISVVKFNITPPPIASSTLSDEDVYMILVLVFFREHTWHISLRRGGNSRTNTSYINDNAR